MPAMAMAMEMLMQMEVPKDASIGPWGRWRDASDDSVTRNRRAEDSGVFPARIKEALLELATDTLRNLSALDEKQGMANAATERCMMEPVCWNNDE